METFLQLVARDLYDKIVIDLSRTAIVFPNKRASLFFNEYLATETDRPCGRLPTSASANCSGNSLH